MMDYTREFLIQELAKLTKQSFGYLDKFTFYQLSNMYERVTRHQLEDYYDRKLDEDDELIL